MNELNDFYKQIIGDAIKKKKTCSPLNVLFVLLILSEVTNEKSSKEILDVLNMNPEEVKDLLSNIKRIVNVNSSIWINNEANVKDINDDYYDIFVKEFNDNINKDINDWINSKTNNLFINSPITIDKESALEIFNTLYVKEKWIIPFKRKETKEEEFYVNKDNKVLCKFMKMKVDDNIYFGDTYTCMSLNFEDLSCINFILPNKDINDLSKDPDLYKLIFNDLKDIKKDFGHINISIPRLKITHKENLSERIKELGIKEPFKDNTKAFKLVNDYTKVNSINELDVLKINEDGVEAASTIETQVGFAGSLVIDKLKEYNFILNKPFVFSYLKHNIPVFVGVVNNPL